MEDTLRPDAFPLERAEVRPGVNIAYVRTGEGGYPLLLVHGWPETKRIWWRNIEPLAQAGFEVIAPDLRGFGDSGLAPDGFYDLAAHARDLRALVGEVLGHERCAAAGAPSVEDLAVGINAVSSSIETAGHGERLLCAVFAFADAQKRRIYFIYNYKRGFWYPFVPEGGRDSDQSQERSTERELQIKAQMASELPIEPELERWFPLWGIPI